MTLVTACCKGIPGSQRDKESQMQLKKAYIPVRMKTFAPVNVGVVSANDVIWNITCRGFVEEDLFS